MTATGAAAMAKANAADAGETLPTATGIATNSAVNAKDTAATFFSFTEALGRYLF
jgi:hypothetical protein